MSTTLATDPRTALLVSRGLPRSLAVQLAARGSRVLPLPPMFDEPEETNR